MKHRIRNYIFLISVLMLILLAIMCFFKYKTEHDIWYMTNYSDDSGNQGMFYTIRNEYRDKLIVIDGGWSENTQKVRRVIKENGNVVDAWFITHYHNDHVDAFNQIFADPQGIDIKMVYDSPMDYEEYLKIAQPWDFPDSYTKYLEATEKSDKVTHLNSGDKLVIENLKFDILSSYGEAIETSGSTDIPNDASLVFKISGKKDSVLFCADCHSQVMADYLIRTYDKGQLNSEYVQLGHHGNNSFPTYFYDYVDPDVALFDAPEWLMTGENYTAKDLKKYFIDKGAECYDFTTAPNTFIFK